MEQQHDSIKFKILRDDLLPHLNYHKNSKSLGFNKFSKQSFENGWKGRAELKREINILRVREREG
jgi:hypothetical protein